MKFSRVLSVVLLISTLPVYAQQQMASLTGQITDSSGARVPGAQVTITDTERGTKIVVTSDENGGYIVPQIPPADHYMITVSKPGFKETVQRNVILQVAQSAKIDLVVSVGDVTETVNVSATPPQLETQTSSLGQVITGQTVEALPLNGRSTFRLIALTPGVTFQRSAFGQFGDVPVNSTWDTNFSINGGRAQSNEILIDGVPSSAGFFDQITTLPIVDETQEFKVESNNLSAIYGRYSGGAINVTTKSGTNRFHGDVFEFIRNNAFDANEWFNKAAGGARNPFHMNQFGGTIGGPVSIPHLYSGHDRTFFFFAYQGTRRTQGSTFTGTVPTAAQRTGDFSALCTTFNSAGVCTKGTQIYNPFSYDPVTKTRAPFAFNQIPSNLFDPVSLKMQAYYPLPNTGGPNALTKNFISLSPTTVSQDVYSGRIDQNVTQNYHVSGRYAFSTTPLTQPNVFNNVASTGASAVGTTAFRNQSFALNNVYQFSPTLLLNVNYGFARWFQSRQTRSYGFDNSTLGFPSNVVSAITIPMFPAVNIGGGYSGLANQSYLKNGNDSHAVLISATKLFAKQTLTAGLDVRLHRINFFNVSNSAGTFAFAIAQTQGPVPTTATGGNAYASFLLGFGSSGSFPIGSGNALQDFYGAVYVQDDVRLTQRLTINLGVRYDGESPYTDRHNQLNYFDPNVASPARNASFPNLTGGLVFAGGSTGRTVYSRQHGNVGPRVGFAFSPQATTSVRGGFGISYAPLEISSNAVGFVPSLGFSSSTAWNTSNDNGVTPANLLHNPFPQGFSAPTGNSLGTGTQLGQSVTVWNHNPPTPYSMQWNLDVQQQFPSAVLLDLGYSGSRGEHLTGIFDRNTLNPQYQSVGSGLNTAVANPFQPFVQIGTLSNATVARRQLLLPYPQFLSVTEVNNPWGDSNYHSLQAKLVKRMSSGLSLLVSYTWSKLISNINSEDAPIGPSDNTGVQNYYDLRAERAVSESDQPQNLVLNAVYELPFGHGKQWFSNAPGFADKLIGGWKLTSIVTEQSGFPLTLTAAGVGGGTRPNLVPGVDPQISGKRSNQQRVKAWFNTAAFVTPPSYTFGTLGRTFTAVRGPGISNLDSSLEKFTKFEGLDTEFRVEMFNVTNTPHFAMPDMARQDAAFGTISSTLLSPPQREMQFALKINF
ncbi:MAG TPA: carboxypeptidase regulatory-like domain-containing protein [Bryocella sp.]|nr:carboxypeptidase regulatory-like domain-containing protein [Bryocella sp.]